MRDSLIRSQGEATKLQCRMIGIPKEWRDADLKSSNLWENMPADTNGKVWVRRDGTGVGIAEIHFRTTQLRASTVKTWKQLKPMVDGKNIYLNYTMPEIQMQLDKPLKEGLRKLKMQFVGADKSVLRMDWKSRSIVAMGKVLGIQCAESMEFKWCVDASSIVDEDSIRNCIPLDAH